MANANENVNPTPQNEGALPEPQISGEQAGQAYEPASGSSDVLKSFLESPELKEYIGNQVKSQQDVRLGKYGTRLENLEDAITQYEAEKGGTVDAKALSALQGVQRNKDLVARLEALEGGKVPDVSPGGGAKDWKDQQASILSKHEIDVNDPRNLELIRNSASQEEYVKSLESTAGEWSFTDTKKPKPSASTVAGTVPNIPSGDGSYTADKYAEDMNKARGNRTEIQRIKAAARADGVDVDNIGFT